ncbi:MAG TPA: biopolymer transporter ExbD [Pontiella sp.]
MNLNQHYEDAKMELQIAPLIDVVFLLLIYFMVTASLIKKEADISFILPASTPPPENLQLPIEVLIEITLDGAVIVEGLRFSPADRELNELYMQVASSKALADAQGVDCAVNVLPHPDALHYRIIDVMDACAAAGVKSLSFSQSSAM